MVEATGPKTRLRPPNIDLVAANNYLSSTGDAAVAAAAAAVAAESSVATASFAPQNSGLKTPNSATFTASSTSFNDSPSSGASSATPLGSVFMSAASQPLAVSQLKALLDESRPESSNSEAFSPRLPSPPQLNDQQYHTKPGANGEANGVNRANETNGANGLPAANAANGDGIARPEWMGAPRMLLIDTRPYTQFSKGHIPGALNMCIPSTLLKRQSYGATRALECMSPWHQAQLGALRSYDYIVLYDQHGPANFAETGTPSVPSSRSSQSSNYSALFYIAAKFVRSTEVAGQVFYLSGGMSEFELLYPNLIVKDDRRPRQQHQQQQQLQIPLNGQQQLQLPSFRNPEDANRDSEMAAEPPAPSAMFTPGVFKTLPPISLSGLGSALTTGISSSSCSAVAPPPPPLNSTSSLTLGGFQLPDEATKDGPMKAFASNIRTAMEVYDYAHDSIVINLPSGVPDDATDPRNLHLYPRWLCDIIGEAAGSKIIARQFHDIEMAEKTRLQALFDRHRFKRPHHATQPMTAQPSNDSDDYLGAARRNGGASIRASVGGIDGAGAAYHRIDRVHELAGVEQGSKNRYSNVWPFNHSRVHVKKPDVSPSADYINANYISTTHSARRYIATQGPLPTTYEDFWRVVWDDGVAVIVMLTPEKEGGMLKCDPYWHNSDFGVPGTSSELSVKSVDERFESLRTASGVKITVRQIELKSGSKTQSVMQLQYLDWPDLGSPASVEDLMALSKLKGHYSDQFQRHNNLDTEPVTMVHCSAGCGRTGTFCAVDTLIDIFFKYYVAGNKPELDYVHDTVHQMRQQRISMVQNLRQYALCYEAVIHWVAKEEGVTFTL